MNAWSRCQLTSASLFHWEGPASPCCRWTVCWPGWLSSKPSGYCSTKWLSSLFLSHKSRGIVNDVTATRYLSICFLCPSTWPNRACLSDSLSCSRAICSKSWRQNITGYLVRALAQVKCSEWDSLTFLTWIRNRRLWKLFFTSALSSDSLLWGPVHSLTSCMRQRDVMCFLHL